MRSFYSCWRIPRRAGGAAFTTMLLLNAGNGHHAFQIHHRRAASRRHYFAPMVSAATSATSTTSTSTSLGLALSSVATAASSRARQQQHRSSLSSSSCRRGSSSLFFVSAYNTVAGAATNNNIMIPRGGASSGASAAASNKDAATCASSSQLSSTAATAATETTTTTTSAPKAILRSDYQPLPYTVREMEMDVAIYAGKTVVQSQLTLVKNSDSDAAIDNNSLTLDGDASAVKLVTIAMDGRALTENTDYTLTPTSLTLHNIPPTGCTLTTTVELIPEDNTQLSGLYKESSPTTQIYLTQCEAEGFRRITYYPDRPDNMAVFSRVRIEADKATLPVLLANGDLIESGDVDGKRHYAVWRDPYPKPSYLFCLVAGNLGCIRDTYTTQPSGRRVELAVYSEASNIHKLQHAMDSLKRSMVWDEQTFGLEYDLAIYNIVATNDFNMGAMENKGLNVFNAAYVLADQSSATDRDYENVEGVIGHEYFHNWTGNRVTCRDWFQLTLKEGLTVYRDQEFSGDLNSKPVKRIEDVSRLRGGQFSEDAGPMKHPVRPDSYISMDNFYTSTVYVKGAEIVRMYQTLLGRDGFRKGMDLYFERHDGSAVTCDDFLAAMADANSVDLSQFQRWYSTPGTPVVKYSYTYDADTKTFALTLSQTSLSTEGPLHIPIAVGLLDKATGDEVVPTRVLDLKEAEQTFTFENLKGDVVPSILRAFSAPVKLEQADGGTIDGEAALAFLAARDTDGFNRWEAGQKLYTKLVFEAMDGGSDGAMASSMTEKTTGYVTEAFERTLADTESNDYSIQAYSLTLPSESTLAEEMEIIEPQLIHQARGAVKKMLARKYKAQILARYNELTAAMEADPEFKVDATSIGRRRLRNVLLEYLCTIKDTDEEQVAASELAYGHFSKATGMTDKLAALQALASMSGAASSVRDQALQTFYDDAQGDALVLDKWFRTQALATGLPDMLDRVEKLSQHPDFTLKNPNRCRSLLGAFSMNPSAFHDESGAGYRFLADKLVELDKLNPQVSARMGRSLIEWKRYNFDKYGSLMKAELEKLASHKLSDDLYEIVTKGLE